MLTASLAGDTDLAVHNLLGGVATQLAILVLADALVRHGALTGFSPRFPLLMLGVGLVTILGIAVVAMSLGGRGGTTLAVGALRIHVDPGTLALPLAYGFVTFWSRRSEARPRWRPVTRRPSPPSTPRPAGPEPGADERGPSLARLIGGFAGLASIVFGAGWAAARLGGVLAGQTGLGPSFIGVTLMAIATSLPEISTTVSAARRGNYSMAIASVLGSNLLNVSLLFVVSLAAGRTPFPEPPPSALFAAGLGIVMTCVYLWGLLEHRDRTVGPFGIDSIVVLVLYVVGIGVQYTLREAPGMADQRRLPAAAGQPPAQGHASGDAPTSGRSAPDRD